MSGIVRLAFFVALSAGLHAAVLLEAAGRSANPRPVRTTVITIPEKPPADPKAVRATPPAPPPPPPVPDPPAPGEEAAPEVPPLGPLTRPAEEEGRDRGRPPVKTREAERPPAPAGDERVATPFRSREEYLEHLHRLADRAPRDGRPVPDLITDNGLGFHEVRDLLRFFGCKVVAYPLPEDGQPSYYLELEGENFEIAVRREGSSLLKGFSNRARDLTGHPTFWDVLARVGARHHLDPYHARIAAVVPERIDRYFVHEQQRAVARAGLALESVRATHGRFRRTRVGWLLEIHAVEPIRGQVVPLPPAEE
ncbi:MAG: hypothetical protein JXQ29_03265 [Planctomycetes bacterium]|nr:hypothetical protein [Planctomycetota bacterium]